VLNLFGVEAFTNAEFGDANASDIFWINQSQVDTESVGNCYCCRFDPTTNSIVAEVCVSPTTTMRGTGIGWNGRQTVLVTGAGNLWKSTDGGTNFSLYSTDFYGAGGKILYSDTHNSFFVPGAPWKRSKDNGVTWETWTPYLPPAPGPNMWLDENDHIWCVGNGNGYVYKSEDGGDNWSTMSTTGPTNRDSICVANGKYILGSNFNQFAHWSTDLVNWTATPAFGAAYPVHIIYDVYNDRWLAMGGPGMVSITDTNLDANGSWTYHGINYLGVGWNWSCGVICPHYELPVFGGQWATGSVGVRNRECNFATHNYSYFSIKDTGQADIIPNSGYASSVGWNSIAAITPGMCNTE
jgi:hypothetical protein